MDTRPLTIARPQVAHSAICTALFLLCLGCQEEQRDGHPREDEVTTESTESELRADSATLRSLIARSVGGLEKLKVPKDDLSIPLPPDDPARPGRYATTEAKRYLGKLLFHDPVRTTRINVNEGVNPPIREGEPRDLPPGTAFGGTVDATNPAVQAVVDATLSTTSCGSCHLSEAAGKAGATLNFASGGEGRGYTDAEGNFIVRRRPQRSLIPRANSYFPELALFDGDTGADVLPTLTDLYRVGGVVEVATPARQKVDPLPEALLATGRLDQLDSVARQSPSMIGFAFNNRLLLGGFAGESNSLPGGLNPLNDPAQENLTLLLLDAHRMLGTQSATLQAIPAFVELFRQAFPEEARAYDACKAASSSATCQSELDQFVNDETILRATATFLRTTVTRDTPFDQFLDGKEALTARQRDGAALFFTRAAEGGAGCFSCHSGPMLNKQPNDPDVTGRGAFVEENFFNLGIGDHPLQALNALQRGHLTFDANGKPSAHGEDTGRQEITHDPADAYKFRSLTLRQLKDARTFFHNGSFTSVRDVVRYFNAGQPQDTQFAGTAATLDARFTHPRGEHAPRGLGLRDSQVEALTDFIENGLYDPGFAESFRPNTDDLSYSTKRPELTALGARDGQLLSGRAVDNDDPLSRRDQGLEFLDVTDRVRVEQTGPDAARGNPTYRFTNTSDDVVDTHLLIVVHGLPKGARLHNASGTTNAGEPYVRVFLPNGVLMPGASISQRFTLSGVDRRACSNLRLTLLSGQGTP